MAAALYHGDALDVLATLPPSSIDLIVADPPYWSTGKASVGDRQWRTAADYLAWLDLVLAAWQRLLKPNGSLYCFAAPAMTARVEVAIGQRFNVLNQIVWLKHDGTANRGGLWSRSDKEMLRTYFPQSERIIFAEHHGSDTTAMGAAGYAAHCDELRGFVFEPLRAYLDGERRRAGFTYKQCNAAIGKPVAGGGMSTHFFSDPRDVQMCQWALPTLQHYRRLQEEFNMRGRCPAPPFGDFHPVGSPFARFHPSAAAAYLRADYEYLRADYEYLRREYEDLRRPFHVTADVPYTDVWDFPTVAYYPGKHPCEKPRALLDHLLAVSSRPGAVVLDPFLGSGVSGVVALAAGRSFIGIERDARYFAQARARIEAAQQEAA